MGDASHDIQQLSDVTYRLDTFGENVLSNVKGQLANAGFFYTRNGMKVKCFNCKVEFDASEVNQNDDVILMHINKNPECKFAQTLKSGKLSLNVSARSKKFLSYDSLRYEKERLETFIEWPINFLSPDLLAKDGFYYLRTSDHCACVFCRGIVGAWEEGDTPRGEHQRHFPHCPFLRGQPVGNVPLQHSTILDKLPLDGEEFPLPPPRCEYTIDEAGTSNSQAPATTTGRHMPGSYAECKGPEKKEPVNFSEIGLRQYTGPKRKDYVTKESRFKSFGRWPERVVQRPEEMADAGFFYCGLSDHVRCFHCGNGLRNWESDDKPWVEHARWYPDCSYLLLSKGQEFIDTVRREKPPYLRSVARKDSKPKKVSASSGQFKPINDEDLEPLMTHDIIQAVKVMGFPINTIKKALRQKLEQTGMPFFCLEPCIEAVLKVMEEETRQIREGPSSESGIQDEAMSRQSEKMEALNLDSRSGTSNLESTPSTSSSATVNSESSTELGATSLASSEETPLIPVAEQSTTSAAPAASSTSIPEEPVASSSSQDAEGMDIDEEQSEAMETQGLVGNTQEQSSTSPSANISGIMEEADERISKADLALKPSISGPSSLELKPQEEDATKESSSKSSLPSDDKQSKTEAQSQKDIAEELERIRESMTCKICMDAKMSVVFLPCTHMATCADCAVTMTQCPICRHDIKYTIKPILS